MAAMLSLTAVATAQENAIEKAIYARDVDQFHAMIEKYGLSEQVTADQIKQIVGLMGAKDPAGLDSAVKMLHSVTFVIGDSQQPAEGPGADECNVAGAAVDGLNAIDLTGLTNSGPAEPSCGFPSAGTPPDDFHKDAWFTYVATCTGALTVDTCGAGTFDTRIAIYNNGLCGSLGAPIECNDDHGNATEADSGPACPATLESSMLVSAVTMGNTYIVRVGNFSATTGTGADNLNIACLVAGAEVCDDGFDNDFNGDTDCADAACMGLPNGETACFDGFDNDCDGTTDCADLDCQGGMETDCGDGNDNDCDGDTDCADADCAADAACLAPANDDCSGAIAVGEGSFPFDTANSTLDATAPVQCDLNLDDDVWFAYTASCTGQAHVEAGCNDVAEPDTVLEVFGEGTCATLTTMFLGCEDDTCGTGSGFAADVNVPVTSGNTYMLRISGFNGGDEVGTLDISCTPFAPEAGNCADGLDNDFDGDTDCADADCALDPVCGCACVTPISVFPHTEDFEDDAACTTTCAAACLIGPDWRNEVNVDSSDWTVDAGGTGSGGTGPAVDNTLGTALGNYAYLEATSPCDDGDEARLLSQCYDTTSLTSPAFRMFYHMLGAGQGDLLIDISTDDCGAFTNLFTISGDQGDVWTPVEVALPSTANVRVRVRTLNGTDFTGDVAIDDLYVGEAGSCGDGFCIAPEDQCNCAADCGAPPLAETDCFDGIDNDCDTFIDCADTDCQGGMEVDCFDGVDNDCDGNADCADADCLGGVEVCTGGNDEDCDGDVDCCDSDCAADAACLSVPANDCCTAAVAVTDGDTAFDTTGATLDGSAPSPDLCDTGLDDDIWYVYTATCSGTAIIGAGCADVTTPDVILEVFGEATCPPTTQLGCEDDACGMSSGLGAEVSVPVASGTSYLFRIGGFLGGDQTGTLSISCVECGDAICDMALEDVCNCPADCGAPPLTETICDDGLDGDCDTLIDCLDPDCMVGTESDCGDGLDNDCDGMIDCADTDCQVGTETSCTDGIDNDCDGDIDCADTECPLVADETADCFDGEDNDCDTFVDCADTDCAGEVLCAAPTNDACIDRIAIVDGTTVFNLELATDTAPVLVHPSCNFQFGDDDVHQDIWYNYTATATGSLFIDTCGSGSIDTRIAVYEGCADCPPLVDPLECNDDHGNTAEADTGFACPGTLEASLSVQVIQGTCYKIRVGAFSDAGGIGGFDNLNVLCDNCQVCGDGMCLGAEDQCNCPADCGVAPGTEGVCGDGIDNDCDGDIDCADTDCQGGTEATCNDGIDNDCDGMVDCVDADCVNIDGCPATPIPTMSEWGMVVTLMLLMIAGTIVFARRRAMA